MCDGKPVHVIGVPLHWGFIGETKEGLWPEFADAVCRRRQHRHPGIQGVPRQYQADRRAERRRPLRGRRRRGRRFRVLICRHPWRSLANRLLSGTGRNTMAFEFELPPAPTENIKVESRAKPISSAARPRPCRRRRASYDRSGQADRCLEMHRLQGLPGRVPGVERPDRTDRLQLRGLRQSGRSDAGSRSR